MIFPTKCPGNREQEKPAWFVQFGARHSEEDVRSVSHRVVGFAYSKRIKLKCVQCNNSVD